MPVPENMQRTVNDKSRELGPQRDFETLRISLGNLLTDIDVTDDWKRALRSPQRK